MDGRDPDTSHSLADSAKAKAWTAVRRTLGRLVSRVGVRVVAEDERVILSPVLQSDLTLPPPQYPAGSDWKPTARTRLVSAPQAAVGSSEGDLLPSVSLAQEDYALRSPRLRVMPIASAEATGMDQVLLGQILLEWPVKTISLPGSFLSLPPAPVRVSRTALIAPTQSTALRGWPLRTPPVQILRLPRLTVPRVRWGGDSVLRRMPLTRRGKEVGEGVTERRRLAETVNLNADEVTLLGIYPDVPILAVERIVVEDEGRRLRLWLKPEVLRGRSASHRITLLVGRQNVTGKMLQAAL